MMSAYALLVKVANHVHKKKEKDKEKSGDKERDKEKDRLTAVSGFFTDFYHHLCSSC